MKKQSYHPALIAMAARAQRLHLMASRPVRLVTRGNRQFVCREVAGELLPIVRNARSWWTQ